MGLLFCVVDNLLLVGDGLGLNGGVFNSDGVLADLSDFLNGVHDGGVLDEGVGGSFLVIFAGDGHGGDEESAANKR